jgi:uncharacterized protein YndB with AHSA1/START domain
VTAPADRELRAEVTVGVRPEVVWELLTDFRRMPEWSPELVRMVPLGSGGPRLGRTYVGINRRKAVVWPTRNVLTVLEPGRSVGWDTRSSGARWVYELVAAGDGTRVTLTRPVPRRLTVLSRAFATVLLGGSAGHADELEDGMHRTLERFKAAAESR